MPDPEPVAQRPTPSRGDLWLSAAARRLQQAGVRPNQISVLGTSIAAVAAACLVLAGRSEDGTRIALLVVAAIAMPLRLLCNVLDGTLAVQFDLRTPSGAIYNELPDRLSDLLILVGAGYAIGDVAWGTDLGWVAAAIALLVAYTRILGVAARAAWHFEGPMSKPRRMQVLLVACLLSIVETVLGWPQGRMLAVALIVIIAGGVVTIVQRLRGIVDDLETT